tara:strand:- start:229 stop:420 length:192 start_codon:yes stop_codon:yes gene_type:complete
MNMSRKHYEEIALILGRSNIDDGDIENLADYFKMDNSRFDKQRFINAVNKVRRIAYELKMKMA